MEILREKRGPGRPRIHSNDAERARAYRARKRAALRSRESGRFALFCHRCRRAVAVGRVSRGCGQAFSLADRLAELGTKHQQAAGERGCCLKDLGWRPGV